MAERRGCVRPFEFGFREPRFQRELCPQIYVPSWTIEKEYSPGIMIYNWAEERHKFSHDGYKKPFAISTTKRDYKAPCEPHVSRCFDRLKSQIIMQRGAIPNDLFLRHHGKNHDCAKITWYDEIYNRRRLKDEHGRMRFPEERTWSVPENEWRPEESDFPLQGDPTNWGLMEKKHDEECKRRSEDGDTYSTVYRKSFGRRPDPGDYTLTRFATPRDLSFKYNRQDTTLRDTDFARGKQPERLWHIDKSSGLCEPRHPPIPLYD